MKLAASSFLVALVLSALAVPGALAKPTPANRPILQSPPLALSAVEMEQFYNQKLEGLSPLQRSKLRLSNVAPAAAKTHAAASDASHEPFDWTALGIVVVLATGAVAISALAYGRSRGVGRMAHP